MLKLPSPVRRTPKTSSDDLVSAFESETQAVFLRTRPYSEHAILHVLIALIVTALILMSVAKLDRVVTGPGRIIPSEGQLYVDPLQKAIVRDIRVREGQVVQKGQVLATLDPTFATADLTQLEQKVASDRAEVARLTAEQNGKVYVPTERNPYEVLQQTLFQQRQREYNSSLADFDAQIQNAEAAINRLQQDVATYEKRHKIASDIETMNKTLERQGWNSKLKTMAATDNRMEVERLMTETISQVAEQEHQVNSLKARRAAFLEGWHSETAKALVTARNSLDEVEQDLKKAQQVRALIDVRAPADAIVLKIARASVGSLSGGESSTISDPLFTLARLDSPLEAEIDIAPKDIGFIQPGDPTTIKLDAYNFLEHGTAEGKIESISEGTFTESENGQPGPPRYRARVALTEVKLQHVSRAFRLIPGMTLTADILVGDRSIISYIIEGVLRTSYEAMREP